MSRSCVIPDRHADSGLRLTTVSTMDIGAQSVAVFARPALPQTDATSGNVMRMLSSTCNRRRCVVSDRAGDRKSTRLNSSHSQISYAVFCLKKKKKKIDHDEKPL